MVLVDRSELGFKPTYRGKVRDLFDLGEHLLIIATDRISAYDVVMPQPVPGKGELLTRISVEWFRRLDGIVAHHLVSDDWRDFHAWTLSDVSVDAALNHDCGERRYRDEIVLAPDRIATRPRPTTTTTYTAPELSALVGVPVPLVVEVHNVKRLPGRPHLERVSHVTAPDGADYWRADFSNGASATHTISSGTAGELLDEVEVAS